MVRGQLDQDSRVAMNAIHVEITAFVDSACPGWVECRLIDATGEEWKFVEKVPVVTEAGLDENSGYPQPGFLACEIIETWTDERARRLVRVCTERPWGVESVREGRTEFVVPAELVASI